MYNNMAGYQRRHKPIKLATYCKSTVYAPIAIQLKFAMIDNGSLGGPNCKFPTECNSEKNPKN